MHAMVRNLVVPTAPANARANLDESATRIFSTLPRGRGWASFPFNTLTLGSEYQPILSVREQRTIGYEALLVGSNLSGHEFRADTVFALSSNESEEIYLDWLARALHLRNFNNLGDARGDLFINAFPTAASEDPHYPDVFGRMIEFYSIAPSRIVVEIVETGTADEAQLVDGIALYRALGCQIAIDDFGVGYSNFDRLWRLKPNLVKIEGKVVRAAARDAQARVVFTNMVKLIKECGASVVVEGVEERTQARLAVDVGADYVQGFYFARPAKNAMPTEQAERMVAQLFSNDHVHNITGRLTSGQSFA
jgi:EAL domain-containing protein (putative c-di-GMP-specific phosphodiesterase class I)